MAEAVPLVTIVHTAGNPGTAREMAGGDDKSNFAFADGHQPLDVERVPRSGWDLVHRFALGKSGASTS
jgi:prepilin-type processing-associated H-X9-DG protein